jgi:uncharacterized protein YqgV (UPF0045/DUF77 family)
MKVSIDISMYPLHAGFESPIRDFIRELRKSPFTVEENALSTQIFGDYPEIMEYLNGPVHQALIAEKNCVFVLKIVTEDRSNHVADF